MGTIAVVTDSNSGITQNEAKELGIQVIPMPFYINGEIYFAACACRCHGIMGGITGKL